MLTTHHRWATKQVSPEESALAAELVASLKVNAKDAAKAAKVLAGEDLGLTSVDQLGSIEKEHIDLAAAGLSLIGKKALLKRYEELSSGGGGGGGSSGGSGGSGVAPVSKIFKLSE